MASPAHLAAAISVVSDSSAGVAVYVGGVVNPRYVLFEPDTHDTGMEIATLVDFAFAGPSEGRLVLATGRLACICI